MTDNEVIKELQSASEWFTEHGRNTNTAIIGICDRAIELINRQKAEIEEYQKHIDNDIIYVEAVKAEAVKEFAERLKEDISWHRTEMYMNGLKGTPRTHEITYECVEEYIDNLVKEFTEGA